MENVFYCYASDSFLSLRMKRNALLKVSDKTVSLVKDEQTLWELPAQEVQLEFSDAAKAQVIFKLLTPNSQIFISPLLPPSANWKLKLFGLHGVNPNLIISFSLVKTLQAAGANLSESSYKFISDRAPKLEPLTSKLNAKLS